MNRPVRPIHFGMLSIVFFFNITMSVAGFFKELLWLLNQHTDFEAEGTALSQPLVAVKCQGHVETGSA